MTDVENTKSPKKSPDKISTEKTKNSKHSSPSSKETIEPKSKRARLSEVEIESENITLETTMLKVKLLSDTAKLPVRASPLAAGYDIFCSKDVTIAKGSLKCVETNIAIAVPRGHYGRIAPRSGLALNHGINVGGGVIDQDYRGPVGVILFNHGSSDYDVKSGDRIAQLILEKISLPEVTLVSELDETDRGEGGFGSTGAK